MVSHAEMSTSFEKELARVRRGWQRGLAIAAMLELVSYAAVALAALCWLDLLLALPGPGRIVGATLAAGALLAWVAGRLAHVARFGRRKAAVVADRMLVSRRREVLSALELQQAAARAPSPLLAYLVDRCRRSATERLHALVRPRPAGRMRAAYRRFYLGLAMALVPALLNPRAALTLAGRLLLPGADIPPYSRYAFTVSPKNPQVVYGADQVISVQVSGAPVRRPVRFVTRRGSRIHESACFQASPTEYAQRLERLMQPVEFCFRIGKARSRWHTADVLLQPHLESADLELTPPAYSRKPVRAFPLGEEPLAGLRGTRVRMTVRSNRPLSRGAITLKAAEGKPHIEEIVAEQGGTPNELTFAWVLESGAHLSVMIYDILGTPARKPLKLVQERLPDRPPVVTLSEPAPFSLATPTVKVPVLADVEDDLGLRRADLFRNVVGYRGRRRPATLATGTLRCEVTDTLDMTRLGVTPGQVIELMVEAADTNPNLTGIGASGVARIQIISDEEYAEMVRARTTVEAFRSRFLALASQYDELLRAMETLQKDLREGRLTPEEARARMKALQAGAQAAGKAIRRIAEDFAAFDLEKELAKVASELTARLEKGLRHAGWQSNDPAEMQAALDECLAGLRPAREPVRRVVQQGFDAAAVSRVMALAARFRALVSQQEMLVRRLERYAGGERQLLNPRVMAEQQDKIRKGLKQFVADLEQRAGALPDGFEELGKSARAFLEALEGLDIPAPMTSCAGACRNEKPREAWNHATDALERMRQLLAKCGGGCFGGMCDGKLRFSVPDKLGGTLSQMLRSLLQQYATGVGYGDVGAAGVGMRGASEGANAGGYSALNVPVYGPQRSNPYASMAAGGHGGDGAAGRGQGGVGSELVRETMDSRPGRTTGKGLSMTMVPGRYREAVKAFYGEEEE